MVSSSVDVAGQLPGPQIAGLPICSVPPEQHILKVAVASFKLFSGQDTIVGDDGENVLDVASPALSRATSLCTMNPMILVQLPYGLHHGEFVPTQGTVIVLYRSKIQALASKQRRPKQHPP